jgi:hypothetical protein
VSSDNGNSTSYDPGRPLGQRLAESGSVQPARWRLHGLGQRRALRVRGMWGRGLTLDRPVKASSRLASHAAGRRSGDQFCVHVGDRLVLPTLAPEQIVEIAPGRLQFDSLVRGYIRSRLAYPFIAG